MSAVTDGQEAWVHICDHGRTKRATDRFCFMFMSIPLGQLVSVSVCQCLLVVCWRLLVSVRVCPRARSYRTSTGSDH